MGVANLISYVMCVSNKGRGWRLELKKLYKMSQDTLPEDPWGLLVSLDEDSEKRFPIIRPEFKIGRNKGLGTIACCMV